MWIEDLVLHRNAQNSNVFLVETLDFVRIDQLRKLLWNENASDFGKMVSIDYRTLYEHDIQRQTINDLKDKQDVPLNAMETPYLTLDKVLRQYAAVVVIKYVILPVHAEGLSNVIVPWSHDPYLYRHKSTAIIFTASLGLFNDNVRRLCYQISIPPSSPEEREAILETVVAGIVKTFEVKYSTKVNLTYNAQHINASSGLTLHDTETASMESFWRTRTLEPIVFTDYKVKILRNYGIEWVEPRRGFESVGGYQYLKTYVRERVIKIITHPEIARAYGLDIPRGLLLFGPPGTGKTYFAKALAKESGMPMLKISPADFLRGIVGETESRVKQLTNLIETLTPCITFVDEFDQLSLRRDAQFSGDSGVSRRMQNMLLDWLGDENRKSFIIGATNFIDLDPAFIRPGRIDEIVLVLPPDYDARQEILKVHVNMRKVPVEDVDFANIAKQTQMWNGAELERLVKEASALAMEQDVPKVKGTHFDEAIASFDVDTGERMKNIQTMITKLKSLEQVNQRFLDMALQAFKAKEEPDSRIKGMIDAL